MTQFFDTQTLKDEFDISNIDDQTIADAEFDVLSRYVSRQHSSQWPIGTFPELPYVYLHPEILGFVGTIEEPQLDQMTDKLKRTIRRVIADYIKLQESGDTVPTNVDSMSQGKQSISFNGADPQLKNVFKPLRVYDNRTVTFL